MATDKAEITYAPNFKDTDNPTINYTNPLGSSVTLEVGIFEDRTSSTLGEIEIAPYRAVSVSDTSYTFFLTSQERQALRRKITDSNSGNVRFYIRTTKNERVTHHHIVKTATVTENSNTKPTVLCEISENNEDINTLYREKFDGMYIQNFSKVNVSITASGIDGATISDITTVIEAKAYSGDGFTSDTLLSAGLRDITVTVTDSRGFKTIFIKEIYINHYQKPRFVDVVCYRGDAYGNMVNDSNELWVSIQVYHEKLGVLTDGGGFVNNCDIFWRYKHNDTWSDREHLGTNPSVISTLLSGVFDEKKTYTIEIYAQDDLDGIAAILFDIPVSTATFHLGYGGMCVGVGRYADEEKANNGIPNFTSAWRAFFEQGLEGDVDGDTTGTHYGNVYGEVFGDTTGTHIGSMDYKAVETDDDILKIALACDNGLTLIETTSSTKNIPSDCILTPGIVLRRTVNANEAYVYLFIYDGRIAVKTYINEEWQPWKYINCS